MVDERRLAVAIPAVAQIELVDTGEMAVAGFDVDGDADLLEPESGEYGEEVPVVVGHADLLDVPDPGRDVLAFPR